MRLALAFGLFLVGCAQSKEPAGKVPAAVPAAVPEPAQPEPVVEAPADPFEGISGEAKLGFPAEEALLAAEVPALLDAPALALACLPRKDALEQPGLADARLEALGEEQQAPLGRLRFVRFESDPLASPMRTVPRLCRSVGDDAALYAPLFRVREPAARWLLESLKERDLSSALASLLARAADEGRAPAGPPRVVLVRGLAVAAALPVD